MALSEELERLQKLRAEGALTEAEFVQAKAHVLGTTSAAAPLAAGGATFLHRL